MKRPLFTIGLTYALVTWLAFFGGLPLQHALPVSAALAVTGALLLVLRQRGFRRDIRLPCLVLLSAAAALGGFTAYSIRHVQPYLALGGQEVELRGVVQSASITDGRSVYTIRADFISRPDLPVRKDVTIYAYGSDVGLPGDTVRCLVRLREPDQIPGKLQGTLVGTAHPADTPGFSLGSSMVRLRTGMQSNLARRLSPQTAEVVGAMVLGLGNGVSAGTYAAVNRSGTAHLLAVSGLHLSIVTNLVLLAARRSRLSPVMGYLLAVLAGFLFASLTGFRPSMMRAFLMVAVMVLGQMLSRQSDPLTALGAALLVICILRPHWVLTKSLWLSATSTLGLLLYVDPLMARIRRRIPRRRGKWSRRFLTFMLGAVAVSLSTYVFSAPVLFAVSGWVPLLSPVANMLVAPFIIPLLISGFLCAGGFLPPALLGACVAVCELCTGMVLGVSRLFAALPFGVLSLDAFYLLVLLAGACAGLVVLHRWHWRRELVCYALACLLLAYSAGGLSYAYAQRHTVELVRLGHGSGPTLLLRGDAAVLLDVPGKWEAQGLVQYLEFRGVKQVNAVVLSAHPDQIGSGLLALEQRCGIGCMVVAGDAYTLELLQTALPQTPVIPGEHATVLALDAAVILPKAPHGGVMVQVGRTPVLKSGAMYAIIEQYGHAVQLFADGMYLPPGLHPQVEPVGAALFGEARILLDTGGYAPLLQAHTKEARSR